ncbi:MAG: glycosyl hydrolase family 28-related protein [Verrucomicrobia bacterium]|nr:glycosyl hydrolase family 28-related protein [Verrucomicrobiota bacterium]MDA1068888.1 glycosyl hydrolase family 28-related protein [Verrucomicrobiota bacterium]
MKNKIILLVFNLWFLTCNSQGGVINVSDYGASGDGETVNTKAIQKAIDDCHESGGGRVLFSNGNYVTGTLFLKSNVILHIEVGATLSGSTKISDYASNVFHNMPRDKNKKEGCLIYAENAENIGIEGKGKVDGRGYRSNFPNPEDPIQDRPMLIRFLKCKNVSLQDIVLQNPASWTVAMIYCKRIN